MRLVRNRRLTAALLVGALALPLLAACGIRPTSVPVDAGEAPARAECGAEQRSTPSAPREEGEELREVFLVCGPSISTVRRSVPVAEAGDRASRHAAAVALLAELQRKPTEQETEDGYTTSVPDTLSVADPQRDDPAAAVRLSQDPDDLDDPALAQLVCTLAGEDGSVRLGGPARPELTAYACGSDVLADPPRVRDS
ncbi:hypothetical protein G5C51_36765 [Streptomyces sp. A7024]|uniref:Lipoprotein n=1 Tax=Streptomyces coryli TaxID=1128680 RepID=A0A6G4UDH0_9ACTN|nr:hypothetical protein [Streptomyces coryli]NGN69428.1 hypothetical protein [Streptomyces coryli]